MKILLINPPIQYAARFPGPNSTWTYHELAPPLGLMAISAYIKLFGYRDVEMLNGQTSQGFEDDQLVAALKRYEPAVVGITTSSNLLYNVLRIARVIKSHLPTSQIVLGGPHLTCYGRETVAHPEVDFGVVGEGEYTFLELLRSLDGAGEMGDVTGLVWKKGEEIVQNPPRVLSESLDDLPMPDFSLFDLKQHRIPYDDYHPSGMIISSRGCPYHCTFCSRNYPYYRMRGAESVVEEMEALKNMGCRSVSFYDETFNGSKRRVMDICRLLLERRVGLHWSFRGRVDRIDDEMARVMASAGCVRVNFGVESGTQEMLDRINKKTTLEQATNAFSLCRKHGISTVGFFMLGLPGETREQAEKTIDFARSLDPDYLLFTSLIPEPGSSIYQEALSAGAFPDYCLEFARNPVPDFVFRSWETGMKEAEVFDLMLKGLSSLYLKPTYVLRRLRQVKSLDDLGTKCGMGLRLLYRMGLSWLDGMVRPPVDRR